MSAQRIASGCYGGLLLLRRLGWRGRFILIGIRVMRQGKRLL